MFVPALSQSLSATATAAAAVDRLKACRQLLPCVQKVARHVTSSGTTTTRLAAHTHTPETITIISIAWGIKNTYSLGVLHTTTPPFPLLLYTCCCKKLCSLCVCVCALLLFLRIDIFVKLLTRKGAGEWAYVGVCVCSPAWVCVRERGREGRREFGIWESDYT